MQNAKIGSRKHYEEYFDDVAANNDKSLVILLLDLMLIAKLQLISNDFNANVGAFDVQVMFT